MMSELASQILPDIYACCEGSDRWPHVLDRIRGILGVQSAVVQIFEQDGMQLRERWNARDSLSLSRAALHDLVVNNAQNPRLDLRLARRPTDQIMRDRDRFATGCPQLAGLQGRLASIGLRGGSGLGFQLADSHYFSLILHRAVDDGAELDRQDELFLRQLAPHLEQVTRLIAQLHTARNREAMLAALVDRLRTGVILCDGAGRIAWTNKAGVRMVEQGNHLSLINNRLHAGSPVDKPVLARLLSVRKAGRAGHGIMLGTIGSAARSPVQILSISTNGGTAADLADNDMIALLLMKPGDTAGLSEAAISELFGLTLAEARLAVALCHGMSVSDYADARGISVGTARVQLKQALAKTQTHRQADLVRQIAGSVAAQLADGPH